ncbi:GIY-YIG nuclease family protein [Planctomonas psychrotolerans]|uniref:GIY-YIG nuclease family protein n=1 Tax=Planctomonas psychrotolerans TaxID=2528712 RepID=UPI00123A5F71|nr:GIY-YIG nuclease family protein [Planctomonas psychrotolerans]
MPHVYILELFNGVYYTGSTIDLDVRLAQHAAGEGANFTRKYLPFTLVFCKEVDSVATAFAWEKQIQGWSRVKKRALIEGRFADLPGLSRHRSSREG